MSKLISNYLYNTIYQLLVLVLPMITIPYLSRVIGPEGIGISAYSLSIVQVFMLFATIGIPLYGNRQIAMVREKGKEELSKEFWSIYSIQLIFSVAVTFCYLIFMFFIVKEHNAIFWAQLFLIISCLIDITWVYIGLEELKKTVIRNTIVRIASVFLIFIFVNQPEDVLIYIYINSITQFIGQAVLWFQLFNYITPMKIKISTLAVHLKPLMVVFASQLIIQLYIVVDRIILGIVVNEKEVGFYDQASKIVKLTLTIITSLSTVMLPRIAAEFSKGNHDKIKQYTSFTIKFILLTTLPMTIGLAGIASTLVPWFLGPGFEKVTILIIIMSPIILFIGLSNIFGIQILLPTDQQNKLTISVALGAIASIIFNIILIKNLESIGTAIATIIAEGIVTFVQLYLVIKFINIKDSLKYFIKYGVAAAVMGIVVFVISHYLNNATILVTIIQVCAGVIVYLGILVLIKDPFLFDLIKKVLRGKNI
jgi:O-antigen/teichoic acid export membrane protein